MKRITLRRNQGQQQQSFVLADPPYPEVGQVVRLAGDKWLCVKAEEVKEICTVAFPRGKTS